MFARSVFSLATIATCLIATEPRTLAACHDAPDIPASRYALNGGEATDNETGLTWQRCSVGQTWKEGGGCTGTVETFDWKDAQRQARGGWRVPTKDELATIVDKKCTPTVNPEVFPNMDSINLTYWTSTRTDPKLAWIIGFEGGSDFDALPDAKNPVRLVRGGKK